MDIKRWYLLLRKFWRSIIPELQNQVTHYDVTNRATNCKNFFLKYFKLVIRCVKKTLIVLELVTRDF